MLQPRGDLLRRQSSQQGANPRCHVQLALTLTTDTGAAYRLNETARAESYTADFALALGLRRAR
jgi:hypothetical protein